MLGINSFYMTQGGLGIKKCSLWNTIDVLKHLWHVAYGKDCLWLKWAIDIYLRRTNFWWVQPSQISSSNYIKVLKPRVKFAQGLNEGYWTAMKKGKYTITSTGYNWLYGTLCKYTKRKIAWGRFYTPNHLFVFVEVAWVDCPPRAG